MLQWVRRPGRIVPVLFSTLLTIGTVALCLPISRTNADEAPNVLAAAFTAVSASCVTGLSVVDTATHWSTFGQVVIMLLIQVGGFGIMTMATLLAILVGGRLGLSQRLIAQGETHASSMGNVKAILRTVGVTVLVTELSIALVLAIRFYVGYGYSVGASLWQGLFHSISAFNNAGFALYSDNLTGFNQDIWIIGPICAAIVAGGLGFPVFYELYRRWRTPDKWTVHARVTILGYFSLLVIGCVGFAVSEWNNPNTIGPMSVWGKTINALIGGITPRTAGFNAIDYGKVNHETLALDDALMFIGGGSAGTAGGIKVGTFILLAFVIWNEIRGERDVVVGNRRVPSDTLRQAVTVVLLAIGVVALGTFSLLILTDHSLDLVAFEAISAFGTVGLSTGITATLPGAAQLVLMGLMYVGRIGTVTTATALALNTRHRHYRMPEERPIIG
ncbi:MAG: TrkH family potassium uptake protein [Actinomycetales bacterium]|nr:TrkH family potassium uptake protein [Candidatus Lutibacillus vidarii]